MDRESQFDERFALTFPVTNIPPGMEEAQVVETSKAALSNLLGSMGYFVGSSKVSEWRPIGWATGGPCGNALIGICVSCAVAGV